MSLPSETLFKRLAFCKNVLGRLNVILRINGAGISLKACLLFWEILSKRVLYSIQFRRR